MFAFQGLMRSVRKWRIAPIKMGQNVHLGARSLAELTTHKTLLRVDFAEIRNAYHRPNCKPQKKKWLSISSYNSLPTDVLPQPVHDIIHSSTATAYIMRSHTPACALSSRRCLWLVTTGGTSVSYTRETINQTNTHTQPLHIRRAIKKHRPCDTIAQQG